MLTAPRPDYLATADERIWRSASTGSSKQLQDAGDAAIARRSQRAARLRGALTWRLETEYHERLTEAHVHLNELNQHVDALKATVRRVRQDAAGGDAQLRRIRRRIARLRDRVDAALQRVTIVMARQGHVIETVAINQLEARRERLVAQQTQARYARRRQLRPRRARRSRPEPGDDAPHRAVARDRGRACGRLRRRAREKRTLAELHAIDPDVRR